MSGTSLWNYSGNPGFSAKDQVRYLIGDTIASKPLLNDAEIEWVLTQYQFTPMNAAIRCCEAIVAKFSRQADESVGQVKITFSQKAEAYRKLITDLRNRLAMEGAVPYSGGISKSDIQANDQNSNRVRPDFTKHMMENHQIAPWTTQTQYWLWVNFAD